MEHCLETFNRDEAQTHFFNAENGDSLNIRLGG